MREVGVKLLHWLWLEVELLAFVSSSFGLAQCGFDCWDSCVVCFCIFLLIGGEEWRREVVLWFQSMSGQWCNCGCCSRGGSWLMLWWGRFMVTVAAAVGLCYKVSAIAFSTGGLRI